MAEEQMASMLNISVADAAFHLQRCGGDVNRAVEDYFANPQAAQHAQAAAQCSLGNANVAHAGAHEASNVGQVVLPPPLPAPGPGPASPSTQQLTVAVPAGIFPGQKFVVNFNGTSFDVICPANVVPGQKISVSINVEPVTAGHNKAFEALRCICNGQSTTPAYLQAKRHLVSCDPASVAPFCSLMIDMLESEDSDTHDIGLNTLQRVPPSSLSTEFARLIHMSKSSEWKTRQDALIVLRKADPQVLARHAMDLFVLLADSDRDVREAAESLVETAFQDSTPLRPAIPRFIQSLHHPEAHIRKSSLCALALFDGVTLDPASEAIVSRLQDSDSDVAIAASRLLSNLEASTIQRHLSPIIGALDHASWHVRLHTVSVLDRVEESVLCCHALAVVARTHDGDNDVASAARTLVGNCLKPPALVLHADFFASSLGDPRASVRRAAITIFEILCDANLPDIPSPSHIAAIVGLLADESDDVATTAASVCEKIPGQLLAPHIEYLLVAASHSEWRVRKAVVCAIGRLPTSCVHLCADVLVQCLLDDDGDVRKAAADVAEKLPPDAVTLMAPSIVSGILCQSRKSDEDIIRALKILEKLHPRELDRHADSVTALMGNKVDWRVRAQAVGTLCNASPETIGKFAPQLIGMLFDRESEASQVAADAIENIDPTILCQHLDLIEASLRRAQQKNSLTRSGCHLCRLVSRVAGAFPGVVTEQLVMNVAEFIKPKKGGVVAAALETLTYFHPSLLRKVHLWVSQHVWSETSPVSEAAGRALAHLPKQSIAAEVEKIGQVLTTKTTSWQKRRRAAAVLGMLEPEDLALFGASFLSRSLLDDSDSDVKSQAMSSLAKLKPDDLAAHAVAVVAASRLPVAKIRDIAIPQLDTIQNKGSAGLVANAASFASQIDRSAGGSGSERAMSLYVLELLPPAQLEKHARIIIENLDDRDAKVRSAAQQVAPRLPIQAVADNIELVVEKLCARVNIGDARPTALSLVEKCASTPMVLGPHVEKLLSVASDRRIGASQKVAALKALAFAPASCLGVQSNATHLIELVNDTGYPDVREQAAISLRSLPQRLIAKFGPSIAIRVGDENEAVRKAVAETLGALPPPHQLFTLIQEHTLQSEETIYGGDSAQPKTLTLQSQIETQCDALSEVAAAYAETLATIVRIASTSSLPATQRAEAQDLASRSTYSLRSASDFVATQVASILDSVPPVLWGAVPQSLDVWKRPSTLAPSRPIYAFFKSLRLGFSVGDTHEEKAAYASGQRRTFPGMKFIGEADEARAAELFNHEWQTLAPIAQRVLETVISAVQGNCRFIETGVADDALAIHHCVGKDTSGTTAAVHGFSQQERATELNEKTLPTAHAMVLQVGEDGNPVSSPENDITSTVGRVLRDVYERERRGSLEKYRTQLDRVLKDANCFEYLQSSRALAARLESRRDECRQDSSDFPTVISQAQSLQKKFDAFVQMLAVKTGATNTCAPLKGAWRSLEKMTLRPDHALGSALDGSVLCDCLRGALNCRDFTVISSVVELLVWLDEEFGDERRVEGIQADFRIRIIRTKCRFSNPTSGGWADLLVNFRFVGEPHIMEIQVQHETLLRVRKEGNAHEKYNSFRSAFEILETIGQAPSDSMNEDEYKRPRTVQQKVSEMEDMVKSLQQRNEALEATVAQQGATLRRVLDLLAKQGWAVDSEDGGSD